MKSRLWSIVVFCCLALGCGYTFQGGGSALPPDVKRVYIPLAENNSTEPGLDALLTEALRDRFERFGVITVVDGLDEADAVLRSRILKLSRETGAVTSNTDRTLQFDTTMQIAAELRRVSGPVLWRNQNLLVRRASGASGSVVVTSSADFAAGSLASADLAALEATGTREVARGQEQDTFNVLAEQAARMVYDAAVAPDF